MKLRRGCWFALWVSVIFFSGCEDFFLKKTVSVYSISGNLEFLPSIPEIHGKIDYGIRNSQKKEIREIYLICHPSVEIKYIFYNQTLIKFDQAVVYSYGVYRIIIPSLSPGKSAQISIELRIRGPITENRLILSSDQVFFDAKKIWIPIPFAEIPDFHYTMTIRTPIEYYPVMGGMMIEETVKNDHRVTLWKSEVNLPLLTGNLFITKFKRYQQDNIYFYSENDQNLSLIMNYSKYTINYLSSEIGFFPFSQTHIVNKVFQYKKLEEFIDGEYLANCIHVIPEIFSFPRLLSAQDSLESGVPFLTKASQLKLFEILAHELSHSYISTLIRFENPDHLFFESMTEFLGTQIINSKYSGVTPLIMERNRIVLINLFLKKQTHNPIWTYFYGVNLLGIAFYEHSELYSELIRLLINKYRYTKIGISEVISTASLMNQILPAETTNSQPPTIDIDVFKLWEKQKLYNLSMELKQSQKNSTPVNNHSDVELTIFNSFPINIDCSLVIETSTNIITNAVKLKPESLTNISLEQPFIQVSLNSPYQWLEFDLSDNVIFADKSELERINEELNHFYQNQKYNKSLIEIAKNLRSDLKIEDRDIEWNTLYYDREITWTLSTNTWFIFDRGIFKNNNIYIEAYKWVDHKPFSYTIFKAKQSKKKFTIEAILDPSM